MHSELYLRCAACAAHNYLQKGAPNSPFHTRCGEKLNDRTANYGRVAEATSKWLAPVADFFGASNNTRAGSPAHDHRAVCQ